MKSEKFLQVWRPLNLGQRVRVTARYRRNERGTVIERCDDSISGMGRYGVRLDADKNTTDFVRAELSRVKRGNWN